MIATFWNEQHPLTKQASELYNALVPECGSCNTVEGELLCASSTISYDWYNNGWGCNNWYGAVIFIRENYKVLRLTEPQVNTLKQQLKFVSQYSHGEPSPKNDDVVEAVLTSLHEIIVLGMINTAPEARTANTKDMWHLQEEDYRGPSGDEDDDY